MTMGTQVSLAASVCLAINEDAWSTGLCTVGLPYEAQVLVHRIKLDLILRNLQPAAGIATRCTYNEELLSSIMTWQMSVLLLLLLLPFLNPLKPWFPRPLTAPNSKAPQTLQPSTLGLGFLGLGFRVLLTAGVLLLYSRCPTLPAHACSGLQQC